MSIISSEIEAQKQRDPSYIDSGLQWAWATTVRPKRSSSATKPAGSRQSTCVLKSKHDSTRRKTDDHAA